MPALAARLRRDFPQVEVNSVADLVAQFRERLVYFRQLSYILGTMSLIVTVLLVATLLTITVNERLGEIATLRAIGVSRATVVRQVLAEGIALTMVGAALGIVLGLVHRALPRRDSHQLPRSPRRVLVLRAPCRHSGVCGAGALRDGVARRPVSGVARLAGADRGHAPRGGDMTPPLLARGAAQGLPDERRDGPRPARCLAPRCDSGDYVAIVGPLRQRQVHPAAAPRRHRHAVRRGRSSSSVRDSTASRDAS